MLLPATSSPTNLDNVQLDYYTSNNSGIMTLARSSWFCPKPEVGFWTTGLIQSGNTYITC